MITKFKVFETLNEGEPEIGDYVIVNVNGRNKEKSKIINSGIGKIVNYGFLYYYVEFKINDDLDVVQLKRENILFFSTDIEDLEPIIQSKKYNI